MKKINRLFISPLLSGLMIFHILAPTLFAIDNPNTVERTGWFFNNTDTAESGSPSNLKYFKHFSALPEEITMKVFEDQDLSHLAGKHLFVGYGIVDPKNGDCKVFKKEDTGYDNDMTVCLPYWRIEREYVTTQTQEVIQNQVIKDIVKNSRPPIMYNYCKEWIDGKSYPGGKTTCTSYYDRLAGGDCWDNPKQSKCWVDNCGQNIKDFCQYLGNAVGDTETLKTATIDGSSIPKADDTKVGLVSHQYNCPSGPLSEDIKCVDQQDAIIYPQECETDVYEYCDDKRPRLDSNGDLLGYEGTCSNGKEIFCEANTFNNTLKICKEPIYQTFENIVNQTASLTRTYDTYYVDVLSGEEDIYMAKDNCLRSNTIEDAREQQLYVKIVGNGFLDDDIHVLRHKVDGSHTKVYCNMQHNENKGSRKAYNGEILQCIDNNGNYSFNRTVGIDVTDIVSVQQASENENATGTPFAIGRNHYSSTKLLIDDIEVAPSTFASDFPYYPRNSSHLRTWDNTVSTFSILFPFAGAYDIRFYNKSGEEIAKKVIGIEAFKELSSNGAMNLKLGRDMKLASNIEDDEIDEDGSIISLKANREDAWVEWGGGVFGGKDSLSGQSCSKPNDSYVKNNAVYNILVKDLLTGAITPIPLVYPLAYPNRIFISKLKVYEKREYRCYKDFSEPSFLGSSVGDVKKVCTTDSEYIDFKNGTLTDTTKVHKWLDDTLCDQNCRNYEACKIKTIGENTGFTCELRGGEDLGGDLEGNLFSKESDCGEKCYSQNECVDFQDNKCVLVEETVSEPISDIYGKTVFRKKDVSYKCTDNVQKQVGCAKWEFQTNAGDTVYNVGDIGVETFDFSSNFEKAMTHAANLEVGMLHIWSGWPGECVYGKKWDFSYLSDPMTILSYVAMAYASADFISEGAISESIGNSWDEFVGNSSTSGTTTATTTSTGQGILSTADETFSTVSDFMGETVVGEGWYQITNGSLIKFGLQTAMILAAPVEEDYQLANNLLKGFYGGSNSDSSVVAYNSCMASIGLSFPNLLAWSMNGEEEDGVSSALKRPWEHPIRLTTSQVATLGATLGEEYVMNTYMMKEDDNDFLMSLISVNAAGYINAGEVLCSGYKTYKAMSHIRHEQGKQASSGGGSSDKALQIAIAGVGMFCPPCAFIATIVMDLVNNVFADIDTCNDEDDAMQTDILHYKTLKFNKQEQCKQTRTECDQESFWGDCVRHKNEYCCYDMILTRIFAEGLKAQLGKDWTSCNDITINDLKDISFNECGPGEDPYRDKCMPIDKYSEFEQTLFRRSAKKLNTNQTEGLIKQVQNSMAIMGKEPDL